MAKHEPLAKAIPLQPPGPAHGSSPAARGPTPAKSLQERRCGKMLTILKEGSAEEKENRQVVKTRVHRPEPVQTKEKPVPPTPLERTVSREQEKSVPTADQRRRSFLKHDQAVVQPPAERRRQSESERDQLPPRESLTERFSAEADVTYLEGAQDPNNFRATVKIFEGDADHRERYLVFMDTETRKDFFSTKIKPEMIEAILKHKTFNVFHDKHTLSQLAFATGYEAKEFNYWTQPYKDVEPTEDDGVSAKPERGRFDNGRSKRVAKKEKKSLLDSLFLACAGRSGREDD